MRRQEKDITEAARIHALLDRAPVLRIAFASGGEPYLVPVHFVRADEVLYVHSAPEGRKISLIGAGCRVCFEAEGEFRIREPAGADPASKTRACGYGTDFESVIGYGQARLTRDEAEKKSALELLMSKYAGAQRDGWTFDPVLFGRTAVIRIDMETLSLKASREY